MSGRLLPPGLYGLDGVSTGDRVRTGRVVVSAELIDRFAELSGDHFEIHMSRDAAAAHGFDDRVAHWLLVLSLVDGLKNTAPAQFRALASLGWDWQFRAPVLAGDSLSAEITVLAKRATRTPGRGILTLGFAVTNQHGAMAQEGQNRLMVYL